MNPRTLVERLAQEGYAVVPGVLESRQVRQLTAVLADGKPAKATRRHGQVYAMRNLLALFPEVRALAESERLRNLVAPVLGSGVRAVRGTLFDKRPEANWVVPWHQDLTIAVRQRGEVPGFGPWSEKAGVPHVQPPVSVLAGLLAVRLHLDECGPDNGVLRVIPGSHGLGRLTAPQIAALRAAGPVVTCAVANGGALLMHPLLLHASAPAVAPLHRRVIHLEYAAGDLPGGLEWA